MEDLLPLSSEPIPLGWVRVRRTYLGGQMLEALHGNPNPGDSDRPEEWVASVTVARNPGMETIENESLTTVLTPGGCEVLLRDVIHLAPALFLGAEHVAQYGENPALLVKLIDSAERLTIQVHPDKAFAQRVFGSKYGKAEAWYILGGRQIGGEDPYVLIGFKPGVTREKWQAVFERQDIPAMMDCLHKVHPKPGEVYMIDGGVPHAIGPGCFLMEVQEPTDFTLRTEKVTPNGEVLPDLLIHQNAGYENLFDCFHYDTCTKEELKERFCEKPSAMHKQYGGFERMLLGPRAAGLFSMAEVVVEEEFPSSNAGGFSLLIVLSGEGEIDWGGGKLALNQTSRMFLPNGLDAFTLRSSNTPARPLRVIRCFPPSYKTPKHDRAILKHCEEIHYETGTVRHSV